MGEVEEWVGTFPTHLGRYLIVKRSLSIVASGLLGVALVAPLSSVQAAPAAPTGGAGGPGGHHAASYTPPAPTWGTCELPRLQRAGAECADLVVPLDWSRPKGKKITIAVSRKVHTDPDYKGMIAVNPGGPGGSGLIYPVLGAAIPNGVGAKFDWYGFDPRGVGSSKPSLSCDPNYGGQGYDRPNYVPSNTPEGRANEAWWKKTTKDYAKACGRSDAKELLPHMRTVDVARDLDALRRAVGEKKLNYYGFSYGTYLGQVYATLFPKQTGKMVWDGVLNADNAFYKANLEQNIAFDENLDRYFAYLAEHDGHFGLGTDPAAIKKGYYALRAQLDKTPAVDGKLGPDELDDAMLSAGYYVYGWVELGEAYAKLVKTGDGTDVLANYGGPGDDNGFAVYNGVQCTDAKWPSWKQTRRDAARLHKEHPFLTWGNTWYNAPCLNWPAKSHKAFKVDGRKVKTPILLVSETHDAATVYAGALATREKFKTASLIEGVGGTTHSGSLSGIDCTDGAIATYLDTGVVPKRVKGKNRSDLQCDPVPAPEPPAAAALRSMAPSTGSASGDRVPADVRAALQQAQTTDR